MSEIIGRTPDQYANWIERRIEAQNKGAVRSDDRDLTLNLLNQCVA